MPGEDFPTVQLRKALPLTFAIAASPTSHPMRIQPILPLPDFCDLLLAVLILLVAVWS